MDRNGLLAVIDLEIRRLQLARVALTSTPPKTKKKRHLTPEGRARIAAAVKKRWAKQKS
jgi:hypothetical protein